MGLFNRSARAPEPDPMATAVRKAYQLGYMEGERDGAVEAFEAFSTALDNSITSLDRDHPIRPLLQSLRRVSKETAAEIARSS